MGFAEWPEGAALLQDGLQVEFLEVVKGMC